MSKTKVTKIYYTYNGEEYLWCGQYGAVGVESQKELVAKLFEWHENHTDIGGVIRVQKIKDYYLEDKMKEFNNKYK